MTKNIKTKLHSVRSRLRFQLLVSYAVRGLAIASIASVLLSIIGKFVQLDFNLVRMVITFLATGIFAGMIVALLKPISFLDAAFACDKRLGLKERLTSALEFSSCENENPLIPALIKDADRHAARIRPSRDFPIKFSREILIALILFAITIGLYFIPPWQYVLASEEKKDEYNEVKTQADKINEIAREIKLTPPAERSEFSKDIERQLEQLAKDMEFGTLTKREALERIGKLEESIEKNQEETGYNELKDQLNNLTQALAQNDKLGDAAKALSSGDSEKAKQALEKLAEELRNGKLSSDDLNKMADSLNDAVNSMGDNESTNELKNDLAAARDALRSSQSDPSKNQIDPKEQARSLIDAINRSIPEIEKLDIDETVKKQAADMMKQIRDDLQKKLDSGNVTAQDILDAQKKIQDVKSMLEKAGADFNKQDSRSQEEIAKDLVKEAERLEQTASNMQNLDSQTKSQCQSTCQNVANQLNQQISQGSCSSQSNTDARKQLDQVRQQLEKKGASQQQMGNPTSCNNPQSSNNPNNQNNSNSSKGSNCQGLQNLFGSCQNPGSGSKSSSNKSGNCQPSAQQCQAAAKALSSACNNMNKFGKQLNSGNCQARIQSALCQSRSCLGGGSCNKPGSGSATSQSNKSGQSSSNGRQSASGWGTGTSDSDSHGSQVTSSNLNDPAQKSGAENQAVRDFNQNFQSNVKNSKSYETQIEGKFSDQGGSYIFTEVTDPTTGETGYVPYFNLEPADISALMDAMEDQDIPRTYEDFVRFYFEQLANASLTDEAKSSDSE